MDVRAEISGWVVDIHVSVGQRVDVGTCLLTLESMKMQIPVESPLSGVVMSIPVQKEAVVQEGEVLIIIKA